MATQPLNYLTYDLSNTLLSDAVKHARQVRANKSKWSDVVLQVKLRGSRWATENFIQEEQEGLEQIWLQDKYHWGWGFLSENLELANEDYIW